MMNPKKNISEKLFNDLNRPGLAFDSINNYSYVLQQVLIDANIKFPITRQIKNKIFISQNTTGDIPPTIVEFYFEDKLILRMTALEPGKFKFDSFIHKK